ncbi:extracellular solute-binding protein [Paenibacillus piri]|nr:extracellular solute-binding protein [Paenibacillus piri]
MINYWKHAFFLLVSLSLLSAAGCSGDLPAAPQPKAPETAQDNALNQGFPIVNQQVRIRMFGRRDQSQIPWNRMVVFKEYERKSNVKVVFEDVPMPGFTERKNLLFASGELPDAFFKANLTTTEIMRYGMSEKLLVPLDSLIRDHAPHVNALFDKYPEVRKSMTASDGHIYTLPLLTTADAYRTYLKPWVNKKWLQKARLRPPATIDELIAMYRVFRDSDMNGNGIADEIPLSAESITNLILAMGGSWGLENQFKYYFNIEDGHVRLWLTDPRFKEMIMFFNRLYEEKLLDQEIFTQDGATYFAKMNQGIIGNFYLGSTDRFKDVEADYMGIAPYQGPEGQQKVSAFNPIVVDPGGFAITKANGHPEVTMRWIDYFYSEEGAEFYRFGIKGDTYKLNASGKPEFTDKILKDPRGPTAALGEINNMTGGGSPHWISESNDSFIDPPSVIEAHAALIPYLPKAVYSSPIFDKATFERISPIKSDVDKFVAEAIPPFVTGELSFNKWDEFRATLRKIGVEELEKAYQSAYDAMNRQ